MSMSRRTVGRLLPIAVLLLLVYLGFGGTGRLSPRPAGDVAADPAADPLAAAYAEHRSDVQVAGTGVVARILPDDTDGSRHQRFIDRMPSGQTLLIAHNTDLARRIDGLREGDTVKFFGEYEWNPRGGVVHWTHHDPAGMSRAG